MDRTLARLLAGAMVVIDAQGCGSGGGPPASREPVPAGPLGPIFARPGGDGPPIECRGIAREQCESAGTIQDGTAGVALADVERVIVSCETPPCTAAGGAFRIDLLLDSGYVREIGRGGYGEFEQP